MCKTSFATSNIETIAFFRNFRAETCTLRICDIHHERSITGILYDDFMFKKKILFLKLKKITGLTIL